MGKYYTCSRNIVYNDYTLKQPNVDSYNNRINANMDKFAKLWPDTLSPDETLRDLDYEPEVTLPRMVAAVLNAHSSRRMTSRAGFRSIDT